MRISDRVKIMKYSAVRKLAPLATEAEKKGIKVYRLNIGQPNIETPELFFEGLRNIPDHVIRYACLLYTSKPQPLILASLPALA